MESSGLIGNSVSPESTATFLLSRSGHLRSSLLASKHNTTFRYRNKVHLTFTVSTERFVLTAVMGHYERNLPFFICCPVVVTEPILAAILCHPKVPQQSCHFFCRLTRKEATQNFKWKFCIGFDEENEHSNEKWWC